MKKKEKRNKKPSSASLKASGGVLLNREEAIRRNILKSMGLSTTTPAAVKWIDNPKADLNDPY